MKQLLQHYCTVQNWEENHVFACTCINGYERGVCNLPLDPPLHNKGFCVVFPSRTRWYWTQSQKRIRWGSLWRSCWRGSRDSSVRHPPTSPTRKTSRLESIRSIIDLHSLLLLLLLLLLLRWRWLALKSWRRHTQRWSWSSCCGMLRRTGRRHTLCGWR